ncbi:MAG TPA: hypothetical protein VHY91_16680 [Pirellulales bacterium]|jgi:integrase|nr:hypothetical protein [Pirellulales bacterium]
MTRPNPEMTLRQFLVELYAPRHKLTEGTLHQYAVAVDSLDKWHGEPLRLCDLTSETAIAWLAYLQKRPIARITVKNRRRHLLTLWIAAYRVGLTKIAPSVPSLSKPRSRPKAAPGTPAELSPDMLLTDYVHHYARKRSISAKGRYQYVVAANSLDRYSGEPVKLNELSDSLFNDWIEQIELSDSAPFTLRNRRAHLLALWKDAHRAELAPTAPRDVRRIRCPWTPPQAWSHAQVCELLRAAESLDGYIPGRRWVRSNQGEIKRSAFWGLMIRVAWDTGLRHGDILALTRQQLFPDGTVQVIQHKTERWHGMRLHPETLAAIAAHVPADQQQLFKWPTSMEYFRRQFTALVRLAGIPAGSFKKLRKSSATDVEMRFPGCGAAHLGHVVAGDIARNHYLDPRLTLANKPMPLALCTSGQQLQTGGAA